MPLEDLTPSNRFELALSGDMTAEEASNRIEQILAGADIEPADRLEYFLKLRVSGGGGGGGGDNKITFTALPGADGLFPGLLVPVVSGYKTTIVANLTGADGQYRYIADFRLTYNGSYWWMIDTGANLPGQIVTDGNLATMEFVADRTGMITIGNRYANNGVPSETDSFNGTSITCTLEGV